MARILIIDDDRSLLNMVKLMVQRERHEALLAQNGQEGLDIARNELPDLAIVDLMMPGMSGYDVTRQLRDDDRTTGIPILILTARSQPMDAQMARDVGADAFISKPVTAQELMSEVNALLSTKQDAKAASKAPGSPALVAVLGLRGGSGATTIAVNLALALTARGQKVCLVDLSPFSGHAARQLRLPARQSWGDLLAGEASLDPVQVGDVIVTHEQTRLAVLPAPAVPLTASLTEHAAKSLFAALAQSYQACVVDAPSLGPATVAALHAARAIILPMSDDVLAAQTTTGALRMLSEMQIDMDHVHVVLNHVRPDSTLPAAAAQKAIKHDIAVELPYEAAQAAALMKGTPLIMAQPKSAFVQGILRLARAV